MSFIKTLSRFSFWITCVTVGILGIASFWLSTILDATVGTESITLKDIKSPFQFESPSAATPAPSTAAPTKATPKPAPLVLNGIFKGKTGLYAIVNQTLVRTGNTVEGWKVADIGNRSVSLTREGQKVVLTIP
ncbi:MAG: hypothetical protein AAB066_03240 [Candidatus Margulisiibacteriota bacterium]